MSDASASEARRALNRLRRTAEKVLHELDALEGALQASPRFACGPGLEPGRVRRTGGG